MRTQTGIWTVSSLTVGLLIAAVAAFAQPRNPDVRVEKRTTTVKTDAKFHKLSMVLKSKVIIQKDRPAGEVVDVVLSDGGCIEYVVVSLEDRFYVVPYTVAVLRPAERVVFVDVGPTQFEKIEFFAADRWPDLMSTKYREQVFTTFGVKEGRGPRPRPVPRDDDEPVLPRDPRADDEPREPKPAKPNDVKPPKEPKEPKPKEEEEEDDEKPAKKPIPDDPTPALP